MADFVEDALVIKSTSKETSTGGHVYNIQVETEDNGKEWFGCGFEDPELNEGDVIEFEIEIVGDYTNVDMDTLVVVEKAPEKQKRGRSSRSSKSSSRSSGRNSSSRSSGRGNKSRSSSRSKPAGRGAKKSSGRAAKQDDKPEVDWDRKDRLIRLCSCQNTAMNTIAIMVSSGAFALPKKKAEQYDAIQALIEDEAARLEAKYLDICDGNYGGASSDDGEERQTYSEDIPE